MKRKNLALAALLAFLLVGGFQTPDDAVTFRVMSYNIHHGEGNDGKVDLDRIAQVVKDQRANLVGLQEVDKGVARTAGRDMPAELARLTALNVFFNNNFTYQGGEYGNALLSGLALEKQDNTHYQMLRQGEQRGLLQTVVSAGDRKLVFMTTHLDFRPADDERLMNLDEIFRTAEKYSPLPVILCGDFNDLPDGRVHAKMKERFQDAWEVVGQGDGFTFSSTEPKRRIDYVWYSNGSDLEPVGAWVVPSPGSDHMPLVVEFRLQATGLERAVYERINAYRGRKGLDELRWDNRIATQARAHSRAMAEGRRAFGHGGFEERVKATGIQFTSAAENVGENQGYDDPAEKAVDGWLHSQGHRTNIEGDFNLTGIGVVRRRDGTYFFTQIFMRTARERGGR